ncbi:transcriptional regulator [Pseudoalteromonas piscicida]|uniref:Transcriptional regulator n=2 Tax=Pseudoalteromonas piscicida TaxID=43662 RepID=A0A2A5JWD6_PSEO7|nr:transcriptional regulator [Pseudoalteromonas piscicida]
MNQSMKEQESPEQELPSLGQTLATARQNAGISFAEIESRLKMTHAQLTKLEQDDYQDLGPETFVRGYIKNYATLLGLNPVDVLAMYQSPEVPPQKKRMQSFSRRTHKEAHDNRLMMVSYIVLAIVLGSSAFWFWQTNTAEPEMAQESAVTALEAPETDITNTQEEAQNAAIEQTIDTDVQDTQPVNTPEASASNMAETKPQEQVKRDPGLSTVVMYFNEESWVEMFDATQERVAFGVKKAGYTMTVEGKAPFSVILGKHRAVEVTLDGKPVTLPEFTKNRLAKFNLPLAE